MIDNLKAVMQAKQNTSDLLIGIEAMQQQIKEVQNDVRELKEEISKLSPAISESRNVHQDHSTQLRLHVEKMSEASSQLENEIASLKVARTNQQDKLIDAFRKDMQNETAKLSQDVRNYNDLKVAIRELTQLMQSAKSQMLAFESLAKQIQGMDFELSKYSRTIESNDREKLRLMEQVNRLEHLLAKERRAH